MNCIHTHSSHTCCSLMSVENKQNARITMLELGSRQNMMDIDAKRARGKCIANALVCPNFLSVLATCGRLSWPLVSC